MTAGDKFPTQESFSYVIKTLVRCLFLFSFGLWSFRLKNISRIDSSSSHLSTFQIWPKKSFNQYCHSGRRSPISCCSLRKSVPLRFPRLTHFTLALSILQLPQQENSNSTSPSSSSPSSSSTSSSRYFSALTPTRLPAVHESPFELPQFIPQISPSPALFINSHSVKSTFIPSSAFNHATSSPTRISWRQCDFNAGMKNRGSFVV
jgi:hypothetical protein